MNGALAATAIRSAIVRMGGGGIGGRGVRHYYKGPTSTPPMVYIPFWEKCVHFSIMGVALFGYPLWVCYWSEWYVKKGKGEI